MAIGNKLIFTVILALLVACAQSNSNNNNDGDDRNQPEGSAKNVWSGQVGTIDRAKGVEQTLMQSAQRQSGEIDRQGR